MSVLKSKAYPELSYQAEETLAEGTSHFLMLEMIGRDKNVVEFGCARGEMSRLLAARGCRVTGVEIDAAEAEHAREHCAEVFVADLDIVRASTLLPKASFDVVALGDVLEHLRDPWKVLEDLRELMKPGGYVVASIPNVAHGSVRLALLQGKFNYTEFGLLDNTHLRFFTLRTVEELFLRSGYRISKIERTKLGLFDNTVYTPPFDSRSIDESILEKITSDPEHDTFQFVVQAVPLDPEARVRYLAEQIVALREQESSAQDELSDLTKRTDAQRRALERQLSFAHEELAGVQLLKAEVDALAAETGAELQRTQLALQEKREEEKALRQEVMRRDGIEQGYLEEIARRDEIEQSHLREIARRDEIEQSHLREIARRDEIEQSHLREIARRDEIEQGHRKEIARLESAYNEAKAAKEQLEQAILHSEQILGTSRRIMDQEVALVRAEVMTLYREIELLQSGKWWSLKLAFGRVKKGLKKLLGR